MNIAYWTLGEGPPLLQIGPIGDWSLEAMLGVPRLANMFVDWASAYSLVGFDPRNHGASDHGVEAVDLEHFVLDVEAVRTAAALPACPIVTSGWSASVGVAYAAQFPQLITHLILHNPTVTSASIGASKVAQIEDSVAALDNLAFSDEELQEIEKILTGKGAARNNLDF